MTPAQLLRDIEALGCSVRLVGDAIRLVVPAGKTLPPDTLALARANKGELLGFIRRGVVTGWDDGSFDERAAVSEYDGGLSRKYAEALAALQSMPAPEGLSTKQMAVVIDAAARFLDSRGRP